LVYGGQGLGRLDNKVYFVWNALPGETVTVELIKTKKNFCEAIAKEILIGSPERIDPVEKHFLSCSPWQIMAPEVEDKYKIEIVRDVFRKNAHFELPKDLSIVSDVKNFLHYRNKMEYSFCLQDEKLSLGIFNRDTHEVVAVDECCLAMDIINKKAIEVLTLLQENNVLAQDLDHLVLRSDTNVECNADLYVQPKMQKELVDKTVPKKTWLRILLSKKNVEVETTKSEIELSEKINDVTLFYNSEVFFQINFPIFKQAVDSIASFIPEKSDVVDCFSGVGAISLPLWRQIKKLTLIENQNQACELAEKNIEFNKIDNAEIITDSVENLKNIDLENKVLILDPPRAGLTKSMIQSILTGQPARIVYLSCDQATQARDLADLFGKYELEHFELFNFFSRTPHVESLAILTLKK